MNHTISDLLIYGQHFDTFSLGLSINGELSAFVIIEILQRNYGIIHFKKAILSFAGITEYLVQQTALYLQRLGCQYINGEQDLGLDGLRKSKTLYRPQNYLKKYTISVS